MQLVISQNWHLYNNNINFVNTRIKTHAFAF
jgi:hypothetical protein